MEKLTLAFSPCPNDTFIFDAIANKKIDLQGIDFEIVLADVQELNECASRNDSDITKLSYAAYPLVSKDYILLNSGSALGNKCGPLVISKTRLSNPYEQLLKTKIAIPGKNTTANFLFSLVFPDALDKMEMIFSEIEDAVINETVGAGVIIHENRFTYEKRGLIKVIDLGEFWEKQTHMPIPLGGIAIKRSFPDELKLKVDAIIKASVEFAMKNPAQTIDYVRAHSQTMEDHVMMQHIVLYVNEYTRHLGATGKAAVEKLFAVAKSKKLIDELTVPLFV